MQQDSLQKDFAVQREPEPSRNGFTVSQEPPQDGFTVQQEPPRKDFTVRRDLSQDGCARTEPLKALVGGIFLTAALLVVFVDERFQFIDLALELRTFHPAEIQFSIGFLQRLPQCGVVPDRGDQVPDFHVTPPF